jgi:hypothetical protein
MKPVFALLFAMTCFVVSAQEQLTIEPSDAGAVVKIDGELFAEYHKNSGHQPAIWPVIGPGGEPLTRSYPMGPLGKDEQDDHPHHRSLWFAHGKVNGKDFWLEPSGKRNCQIVHKKFEKLANDGDSAAIVTRNDWIAAGVKICEDQRTIVFAAKRPGVRTIDFTIKLKATEGPVTFGDTKEGTFAIRVAGSMKLDAGQGGKSVNSRGQHDADAWGRSAEWVDYSGPAGGKSAGIAILSHPDNIRHPCRWHVRGYGLFAANPFGESEFPADNYKQGAVTIPQGESITLRYIVLLHDGSLTAEQIAELYSATTSQ